MDYSKKILNKMQQHIFTESGLHNIKRHIDFSLQECKRIIIPMNIATVINRLMKFFGSRKKERKKERKKCFI